MQRVLVYSAEVVMFNDPFWFQILFATVSTLTHAKSCWAREEHPRTPQGHSHMSALLGKFAGRCL